jgi:hypothetical protein
MTVYLLAVKKRVSCQIPETNICTERDSGEKIKITIENKSLFIILSFILELQFENILISQKRNYKIQMAIPARNKKSYEFILNFENCGQYHAATKYAKIIDPLKLFSVKIKIHDSADFTVMPKIHFLDCCFMENGFCDESEELQVYRNGDDSSEILGIREYIIGDRMNCINWKISSKVNELMVREYGRAVSNFCCLAVELSLDGDENRRALKADVLLDALVSVSQFLLKSQIPHRIFWYDINETSDRTMLVSNTEDINEFIREIMCCKAYDDENYIAIHYKELYCSSLYPKAIYFTGNSVGMDVGEYFSNVIIASDTGFTEYSDSEIPVFSLSSETIEETLTGMVI